MIDVRIGQLANPLVFNNIESIPNNKVGLLLGTSKYARGGRINQFYKNRIDATVALYQSGKIEYVLVSGDNGTQSYNEPMTMKNDLIKRGIPSERIYLDYAGFRTLDSVVRSKAVFGQQSVTVISQRFHNERAIVLAKYNGMSAVGYNAQDVSGKYGFKTHTREKLARVKLILDLILHKQPKFLGPRIAIGD